MFKNLGQSYSKKKHLKKKGNRSFVEIASAKTAGILINNLKKNHLVLETLVKNLVDYGIKPIVLTYLEKNEPFNSKLCDLALSKKDFNWLGQIHKAEIKKFINSPFDYLICLNTSPFLPFENILAQSNSKCRVGIRHPENANCYELTIGIEGEKNIAKSSQEIVRYLKMIKTI